MSKYRCLENMMDLFNKLNTSYTRAIYNKYIQFTKHQHIPAY